ncbi:hypothetical protein HZA33_03545 [Candidatus Pacearchaeota archaeon]|nr:hypothetical protein [Candidatus Pacearchaeota archaeon]
MAKQTLLNKLGTIGKKAIIKTLDYVREVGEYIHYRQMEIDDERGKEEIIHDRERKRVLGGGYRIN